MRKVLGVVAERIDDAVGEGALDEGDSGARVVAAWGAVQGLMQLRKLERVDDTFSSRSLTDLLLIGLFKGWGATTDVAEVQASVHPLLDQLSRES